MDGLAIISLIIGLGAPCLVITKRAVDRFDYERKLDLIYNALLEVEATPMEYKKEFNMGICSMVCEIIQPLMSPKEVYAILMDLFEGWEHHTGDPIFPVPAPYRCNNHASYLLLDKWRGECGEKRSDLLKYAINKAEKLLK